MNEIKIPYESPILEQLLNLNQHFIINMIYSCFRKTTLQLVSRGFTRSSDVLIEDCSENCHFVSRTVFKRHSNKWGKINVPTFENTCKMKDQLLFQACDDEFEQKVNKFWEKAMRRFPTAHFFSYSLVFSRYREASVNEYSISALQTLLN